MTETTEHILRQASICRRALVAKAEVFTSCHVWTPAFARNAKRWLENFTDAEIPLAAALLDGFLYFSDDHATQLMISGFHALSQTIIPPDCSGVVAGQLWSAFFDKAIVTLVEGENPNITDSGVGAVRHMRKFAGFPESRTLAPDQVFRDVVYDRADDVIFVDDFVGSGNQFIKTWTRLRQLKDGSEGSFESVFGQLPQARAFFCPSVCTDYGLEAIRAACPSVIVSPGTLLGDRHSVLHPESLIWPPGIQAQGAQFVEAISSRLELPGAGGKEDWRGFHRLGLAIAIGSTIPDATLRLFRLKQQGWTPLVGEH